MAFNSNPGKQQFTASAGQTVFNFNFAIFAGTDIKVYKTLAGAVANDATDILTLSTHYTVSINGTLGGTVTLLTGAGINDTVTIVRSLPVSRTTDYVTNGDLYADTLDADQDYQTYLVQDGYVQLERAIIVPESISGVNLDIPAPVGDSYLRWNAGGTALENDTTIPQKLIDATTQAGIATTQAGIATTQATNSANSATDSLSYLNDFKGRYYGALANNPTLDPLGTAMTAGDVYYNSTSSELRYYNGSSWVAWNISDIQFASLIHGATSKTNPVDADELAITDSASSFSLKRLTLANLKATLFNATNIIFGGTAQRIQGDFSNATIANRTMFQTSTLNGASSVGVIPNGTSTYSALEVSNSSDANNASVGYIAANGATDIRFVASLRGTGSYLPITFFTSGTEKVKLDTSGNFLVTGSGGLGYGTGSGGTVTQATSKTTPVTLNKPTGIITTNNASLSAGSTVAFSFNNSLISSSDSLVLTLGSGTYTPSSYNLWCYVVDGTAVIYVKNISGGALSEAIPINFAVIKGATA